MFSQIYIQYWMTLSKETRDKLTVIFSVPKTGVVEVINDTVITDGHNNTDLQVITLDKLKAYTGQLKGTFSELLEMAINKASEANTAMTIEEMEAIPKPYCEFCTSTQGRHRKGCPKYK